MIKQFVIVIFFMLLGTTTFATALDSMIKSIAHLPKSDTNRLSAEALIAWYMMDADINKSVEMSLDGLERSVKINNATLQYRFLVTAATAYQMKQDFPKSIEFYNKAIVFSRKEKKAKWLVNCYGNLANTYFKMNDFQNCIEYNLKGIVIAKKSNEPLMWGHCYQTIAGCSARMKDTVISLKYTKLSLEDTLLTPPHIANAYSNLSNMYCNMLRLDSAKKYLNLMKNYVRENNMNDATTMIKLHVARIEYNFAQNKMTTTTKNSIADFVELSLAIGDTMNLSWGYKYMAKYFLNTHQYDSSNYYALLAENYLAKSKDFYNHTEVLNILKTNYTAKKNYEKALYYANLEKNIIDSFQLQNNAEAIRNAEARFDTRHKEERNELLTRENKIKTKEKNMFMIGGLGVASLLSLFLWFAIRSRNKTALLNQTIEKQNLNLEESNATKDKIFSIISHDLRAPIAGLSSLIQLKESVELPKEKLVELDDKIKSSLQSTSGALDNLLLWSIGQIKNGETKKDIFAINESIQNQINLLKPLCEAKNIQVNFNAPEIYKTENDKNGVAVVVRNLLNNAIKFSQPNSSIGVGLTKEASGKFSITVSDTGTGMSAHQIEQYHQGTLQSTQGTRSETGTGLGFLIIKDYCKKMNAEIIISSTLGKGSEFVFKF